MTALPPAIACKIRLDDPPPRRPVIGPCWTWTGRLQGGGYGELTSRQLDPSRLAHRYTYKQCIGPIPDGLQIDHLCRNRACCNPCHLEPVTNHVNQLRGERATRTHCVRAGHALVGGNIIWRDGEFGLRRQCRACTYEHQARNVAKLRAAGLVDGDHRHGTITGYANYGCRCADCRVAGSAANKRAYDRRARRAAGLVSA